MNLKHFEADLKTTSRQLYGKTVELERSLLQTACRQHPGESAETLLSFKLYPDKLALILSDGRKFEYTLASLLEQMKRLLRRDTPEQNTHPPGGLPPEHT